MHNFFKIFNLEVRYDIEKSQIESKYFELLGKYHPDKASSKEESAKYSQLSSIINDAYQTLLDDLKRASHILQLNNIDINDDGKAPKLSTEILGEILEIQEELEANPKKRPEILVELQSKKNHLISELIDLFAQKNYVVAAQKTMHLKYLALLN